MKINDFEKAHPIVKQIIGCNNLLHSIPDSNKFVEKTNLISLNETQNNITLLTSKKEYCAFAPVIQL